MPPSKSILVTDQLATLEEAVTLAAGVVPEAHLVSAREVLARAGERRGRASDHTVVGLFGATGSGKSSLFNALVGEDLARTHVTRPTTRDTLAAVWEPAGSERLLEWLEVRNVVTPTGHAGAGEVPLMILDLPDFDSVEPEHRAIAERLTGQVDVLVWVVDPQKYADATLHVDFVRPLAHQGAVTLVVLNQIDRLAAADVPLVKDALSELLRDDGLTEAAVFSASARTGEGIAPLHARIFDIARRRAAADERLSADVRRVAAALASQVGAPTVPRRLLSGAAVTNAAVRGTGAAEVADAVARSYRKRAGQATGWPLTAWLLRLRPDPLRRLRLEPDAEGDEFARTSLVGASSASQATLRQATRQFTVEAAEGLSPTWRDAMWQQADAGLTTLADRLDSAVAGVRLGAGRSWWWPVITVVQWLALVAAVVGAGWYLVAWGAQALSFPPIKIPRIEGWPVPALLITFGVLLGIVLGLASAGAASLSARHRRRRAFARLRSAVEPIVAAELIEPVLRVRERAIALNNALATISAGHS